MIMNRRLRALVCMIERAAPSREEEMLAEKASAEAIVTPAAVTQ